MREQHESDHDSDSEDEEDVEDAARQYFCFFHFVFSMLHVSNFVCEFQRRTLLYERPLIGCGRLLERR